MTIVFLPILTMKENNLTVVETQALFRRVIVSTDMSILSLLFRVQNEAWWLVSDTNELTINFHFADSEVDVKCENTIWVRSHWDTFLRASFGPFY